MNQLIMKNFYSGIEKALGKRLQPYNRLEKAKTILSIGSDFLGSDDNNVYNTRKIFQKIEELKIKIAL
ncbi:MAG: hypothetical protein Ct9H90mP15_04230 [Candidatus Neomarinimicrobiota bacterium]|nr:MAG: hypothetical protein Ct9H90mP15_04230 [Candidatus Neomarinimicrobiota bacterium]